jgi:hypothetical protein
LLAWFIEERSKRERVIGILYAKKLGELPEKVKQLVGMRDPPWKGVCAMSTVDLSTEMQSLKDLLELAG